MAHHSAGRFRARIGVCAVTLSAVVLSVGMGGQSQAAGSRLAGEEHNQARAPECERDEESVLYTYERALNQGVPGGGDFLSTTFETSIQLATSVKVVTKFLHKLARDGPNPIWQSFTASKFDTTFSIVTQEFKLDDVEYVHGTRSAVIVLTVDVDTNASQVPQVLASAQLSGRLVCEQGFWRVALADVCAFLADGTGPPCPKKVKKKAKNALPSALKQAKLPKVSRPTVVTVPTTTTPDIVFTPAPLPPSPGFDGVCPYVGQPCSANVTNDPDCTCTPTGGGGLSPSFGFITCRNSATQSERR